MAETAPLSITAPAADAPDITSESGVREEVGHGVATPRWKIHDRTHIECGIDWRIAPGEATTELEWDAYFFVPDSLRLDERSYGEKDIYGDLRAYVRLAVPSASFQELAGEPLDELAQVLRSGEPDRAVYELRFFASRVRTASAHLRRRLLPVLQAEDGPDRRAAVDDAEQALDQLAVAAARIRETLRRADGRPEPVPPAADWVGEDISRMIESLAGELAVALARIGGLDRLRRAAERIAADEARHRKEEGLRGVAWAGIDKRDVEHLEFRRHVLKRFTASVLWLDPKLTDPSRWVVHLLYALAAGAAMAFAVAAALWNGLQADPGRIWIWAAIAVLAYMAKDRIKAVLQQASAGLVSKRFPDRRWIVATDDGHVLGRADERVGYLPFAELPPDVLAIRRATRIHPLEEQARPETVLWHRKDVSIDAQAVASEDDRVDAIREILRLDLRHWLAHTDDPKRRVVFADPDTGEIFTAMAPRVYNLGIVYRLRKKGDEHAGWHRVRVVVTRKGLRRIDPIC